MAFAVNFRCKPFWYLKDVASITLTQSGSFISNPGSVHAEPVVTVYGTANITLMVGANHHGPGGHSGKHRARHAARRRPMGSTSMNSACERWLFLCASGAETPMTGQANRKWASGIGVSSIPCIKSIIPPAPRCLYATRRENL